MMEPAHTKKDKASERGLASEEEEASRKRLAEEGDVPVLQGASGQEAPGKAQNQERSRSPEESRDQDHGQNA